jgi:hypothetical protein
MAKENNNINEVYKNSGLGKWFDQDWKDISRKKKGGGHPPCGASADKGVRAKDSSKKYPKCVPANKAKNMSKKQKKSAVTRKRRAPNEPGSPDNVRTDVKKESWEKWKPKSKEVYPGGLPSNNAPENPEPMNGAVAFEKNRKKVLAQLKEVIRYLIVEAEKDTVPNVLRRGKSETQTPTDPDIQYLQRVFKIGEFTDQDLVTISEKFFNILKSGTAEKYYKDIENLPNIDQFNKIVDGLEHPRSKSKLDPREKINIKKIVSKMSSSNEAFLEKEAGRSLRPAEPKTSSFTRSPRQTTRSMILPSQSEKFVKDVGEYRKMVTKFITNPTIKKKLEDYITNVQFSTELDERDKERQISDVIEKAIDAQRGNINENALPRKHKHMIIKLVLKEYNLYG